MTMQTSEPGKQNIIKMKKVGEKYSGWFRGARKGAYGFLYDFVTLKGDLITIAQTTDLMRKMALVPEGCWCEITLDHFEPTTKNSEMKVYQVSYDVDNKYKLEYKENGLREPGQEG